MRRTVDFEDRLLLVAAYWRTNLTMHQIAALFGTSKSAVDSILDDLAHKLAFRPRKPYALATVLIVNGTLARARDHSEAARSKDYRCSTNHQVVIHADMQLVVSVSKPLPGNRNDSVSLAASGVDEAARTATVIGDGRYQGTCVHVPHRRKQRSVLLGVILPCRYLRVSFMIPALPERADARGSIDSSRNHPGHHSFI